MERISYRLDGDTLYISIAGRIDASNSIEAETEIFKIREDHPGTHTVIDANSLEYISSAGLRIILRLRKEEKDISVINVSPDVYDIFSMTGFTDMINIEKALRRMSVEGCPFIAKGANGAVYRYDDETIIKTYFSPNALPEIKQERENARKAFVLGINTAIPYDIVRVGDGYGTVTELLNATSVSKLIIDDPQNLELPVKYFIDMLKDIHSTQLTDGDFPDMKKTALNWSNFIADQLTPERAAKLNALIEALPSSRTMLHGDYHTNNVLIQNGQPLLIDLDTLCMGHPIFELGSMYNAFVGFSELRPETSLDFLGFDFNTSVKFWKLSLQAYLDTTDEAVVNGVEEKARIIGHVRLLRRSLRRPSEEQSAERIEHTKKQLNILIDKVDSLDF